MPLLLKFVRLLSFCLWHTQGPCFAWECSSDYVAKFVVHCAVEFLFFDHPNINKSQSKVTEERWSVVGGLGKVSEKVDLKEEYIPIRMVSHGWFYSTSFFSWTLNKQDICTLMGCSCFLLDAVLILNCCWVMFTVHLIQTDRIFVHDNADIVCINAYLPHYINILLWFVFLFNSFHSSEHITSLSIDTYKMINISLQCCV